MKRKTERDIALLTESGHLLAEILAQVLSRVTAGVTGIELDTFAEESILRVGGRPAFKGYGRPPFPNTLCISINDCVVHGIPSDRAFMKGDIIGFDIGMIYEGLYTDMARTIAIEPVSKEEHTLVDISRSALEKAIAIIRPGTTTGDIGACIQHYVEHNGFGIVRDLSGHGVGHELHEEPEIPNFGRAGAGTRLEEGMVVAVEPMITMGDWHVRVGDDQWAIQTIDGSKTAHWEDTLVVTKDGCRAITR